jgi:hypothetical protein
LFEFSLEHSRRTASEISSFLNGIEESESEAFSKKIQEQFANDLLIWESTFFESIPTIQKEKQSEALVIMLSYDLRGWHTNTNETGKIKKAPFGLCACFVNIVPPVKVFQSFDLWETFMDWLEPRNKQIGDRTMLNLNVLQAKHKTNDTMKRNPFFVTFDRPTKAETDEYLETVKGRLLTRIANVGQREKLFSLTMSKKNKEFRIFSNNADIKKVGRDEQYLLFLLAPNCLHELFFFTFAFDGKMKMLPPIESLLDAHREQFELFRKAVEKNFQGGSKTRRRRNILHNRK